MSWKGRPVLVTGADGFIGSHLVEALVHRDARVRAFVYYNSFNSWGWLDTLSNTALEQIEVFSGDVRDSNGVAQSMEGIETVFHLAALIGIPFSYHSPDSYVDTNIKGTLNVLQAARKLGTTKIIHTSTSEVYGTAQYAPIDEIHPIRPQSPYAATKSAADDLALSFYRSFNLPVTILRPFNTFGPRQSARAVIPTIAAQIAAGHDRIELGNLEATRDLNFVKNTVEAFLAICEADGTSGQVFNAGYGKEISIGDLATLIQEVMGREVQIDTTDERRRPEKSEVERLVCSSEKLNKITDWKPSVSLRDGLDMTCKWVSENLHTFKEKLYNV